MFYFSSETTRTMVQALSSWEEASLQGYIIDLRNR
jgi:C-terminal processing protease CtpA/Prc